MSFAKHRSARPFAARFHRLALTLLVSTVVSTAGHQATSAAPGGLLVVSPLGATPGVVITVTGTGFSATANQNQVAFRQGATVATAVATASAVVDASKGIRRLTLTVPAGVAIGPAALEVTNQATGEMSNGVSIDVLGLTLPSVTSAAPGTTASVVVTGLGNVAFEAGRSRVTFGAGVTVTSTAVESPVRLVAGISVAANAALGPRSVTVLNTSQTLQLAGGFTVAAAPANSAPIVSAGANQTITLPAGVSLNGSVTDDGLPTGAAVTSVWTKASGPGPVTFANASSAATTASFDQAGTYVLRLTATDSDKTAFGEVTITVNPAPPTNQAPQVSAGAGQTITLPATASLGGTVTDDGLPAGAAVTSAWTKVSGPGPVTFANGSSAATTASFDQAGSYVLRLTASDTDKSAFGEVTIIVNPAPVTNLAPVVEAGTPQSVRLPAGASLHGSVTDDGRPAGAALTSVWTKVSGPGPVTFGDASSPTTTVSFDQAGTYVLRLTASDTDKSATAEVTIAVNPAPVTNVAPVVSAGTTQTVTLPAGAILNGSVTDDGLPAGAPVISAWTKASGPGTAVFANVSSAATSATFSAAGTYVLRLTATDTDKTSFAEVTVNVNPGATPNAAPVVTAGQAQTITLPAAAALTGSVTDDGHPQGATLTRSWTKVSGPGPVTFADASSAATTATFDQPGSYVLRLTASDTDKSAFAEVTITVNAAPPTNLAPVVTAGTAQTVTLPATASLNGTATDDGLPSNALTVTWQKKSGPGTVTFAPPTAAVTVATFSAPGTYTLEIRADDGALASTATVDVTASAPTVTNAAPSVNAGVDQHVAFGTPASLAGTATDDGKPSAPLAILWKKTSGPGDVTFAPPNAPASSASFTASGLYVLSLTATDGELLASDDMIVTVDPPATTADSAPPIIKLFAPKSALPGERVTVRAQVSDDTGVAAVQFAVDGTPSPELPAPPFETVVTIPQFAQPGKLIGVHASARDASGNSSDADVSIEVTAAPDTENPTVALTAPSSTSPGKTIVLAAKAQDNVGIASVTFSIGGLEVAADSDAPYEATYLVPQNAAAGVPLDVKARAVDFAGNAAESAAAVDVLADTQPVAPHVTIAAPATASPGDAFEVSATASDVTGIARVTFRRGRAVLADDTDAPYATSYVVPIATPPGSTVTLTAEALNLAGLTASDTKGVQIVARSTATEALVTGAVYDDTTSTPLANATIALTGEDSGGVPHSQSTTTDARGRYLFRALSGRGVVHITKDGWTRVDRPITLTGGDVVDVLDARLTPFAVSVTVSPAFGATLDGTTGSFALSPGALPAGGSYGLAMPTQQGIEGPLPRGWSPVAVADVAPHGVVLAGGGRLRARKLVTLPANATLAVLIWDEAESAWRMTGSTTSTPTIQTLEATVPSTGHFVFALADSTPASPPFPNVNALVEGATPTDPLAIDTTTVAPQPQVLFYKPGVTSEVRGEVASAAAGSSGRVIAERLTESYTFRSGTETKPEPLVEDVVLYQAGSASNALSVTTHVGPSLTFDPSTLERGVIAVELFLGSPAASVQVAGTAGGTVSGPGGESLILPPGALGATTPVTLTTLDATSFGLPNGAAFVAGAQIDVPAVLARAALLSVPLPPGLTSASGILVVRAQQIAGRTRLVLVGVGTIDGNRLVSTSDVGGQQTPLDGIRAEGRYAFINAPGPVGFAGGLVKGTDNQPFAAALVTASTFDVVSLSNGAGAYLAVAPTGTTQLTATDLARSDVGSASAFLLEGAVLPVPLQLVAQPPRVTAVSPADGAQGVGLSAPVVITFSEPIAPQTLSGQQSGNLKLAGPDGARLDGTLTLTQGNTVLTFRAAQPLVPNTRYRLTLSTNVTDVSGYGLSAALDTHFDSLDTTAPPPPPAGSLSASIPNGQGLSIVSGAQGTAGPSDQVFIDNLTRKTTAVALVQANGSFSAAIAAATADKLRVRIVDASGNTTTVDLAAFRQTNADGSVSQVIGAAGGIVDGPDGMQAAIDAGALSEGTVVTMKTVPLAQFPVPLTPQQSQLFPLVKALSIDLGGAEAKTPLRLSIPAGPDDKATDQWLVMQVVNVNSTNFLHVVDTAHFENGRIVDPPRYCPGVLAAAVYGIAKAAQTYGLNYAKMYSDGRYTLQARTATYTGLGPTAVPIPYTEFSTELPFPSCFPVITGRVTISPSTFTLSIPNRKLYLSDRQIVVKNTTRNTQQILSRTLSLDEFTYEVNGSLFDSFKATARAEHGADSVGYTLADSGNAGTVLLTPNLDEVAVSPDAFEIHNLSTGGMKTFAVAAGTFEGQVEGDDADTYEITAVPSTASEVAPHSIDADYTIRPLVAGVGNLVIRALPATIDPTREEADRAGQTGPARTICPTGQTTPDPAHPCGVTLSSASGKVAIVIPNDHIPQGGIEHRFDGDASDVYTLTVNYDFRPPYSVEIPHFQIDIVSTLSGALIKTILGQAPPKDEPLDLGRFAGTITDDTSPPFLIGGPSMVTGVGASTFLSFTFSKAMDADSLKKNVIVIDADGHQVKGEIRVSNGNRTVTFVPAANGGLQLGQKYTVTIKGVVEGVDAALNGIAGQCTAVCDAAGNFLRGTILLPVTTFGPQLLQHVASDEPMKDVQLAYRTVHDPSGDRQLTYAFVTSGSLHLKAFDVTDVSKAPRLLNIATAAQGSVQRIALVPNPVNYIGKARSIAAVSAFTTEPSGVNVSLLNFFDVTDPIQIESLGRKILTRDSPDIVEQLISSGTGFAKGVTAFAVPQPIGILPEQMAYAAVERIGLYGVNIGVALTSGGLLGNRLGSGSGSLGGDFTDLVPYRCHDDASGSFTCDRVVAIKRHRDGNDLVVLSGNLGVMGSTRLPSDARRVRVVEQVSFDSNGNGKLESSEILDLAVVAGENSISFVLLGRKNSDIGDGGETLPRVYGQIPIRGSVLDVEVDGDGHQIMAGYNSSDPGASGSYLAMIDMNQISRSDLIDEDRNGVDDRIVFRAPYPAGINAMHLEKSRQLLYIASPTGLDIYRVGDLCCDVKVDLTAKRATSVGPSGATADLFQREKKALKTGIVKGLARAAAKCDAFDPAQMRIWESGSSSCLWTEHPELECGNNYQPGLSDHDLSTFMPDAWYRTSVKNPDKTTDPKDKRPDQVPLASCVIQSLTYPFQNPNIKDPKLNPREPDDPEGVGFKFVDISFLPNYMADLGSMRYRLARTMPGIPGDSDNTLGLGMQGLILKHLTEAVGVELSGVESTAGYQASFTQVGVSEAQIEQYLEKYRTDPTVKIPTVEGYEWANLMEYQLRKAYSAVRIRGSADETSQFHDFYVSQLHLAGKAGIRAALGRLSAVEATRDLILNFRRTEADTRPGPFPGVTPLTLRGDGANACKLFQEDEPDPTQWSDGPCTSMEHYVASVAVRALDLQSQLPAAQQLFTRETVRQVFDFYRVKADELHIDTDQDADAFMAATFRFVLDTKSMTEPAWTRWINRDSKVSTNPIDALPDPDQTEGGAPDPEGTTTSRGERRVNNIARKEQRMQDKAEAHLHIVPHVTNRSFRTVTDIKLSMFFAEPGGEVKKFSWKQADTGNTINDETLKKIVGGEHLYPQFQTDSDGSLSRDGDPNDEGVGKTIDLFELEVNQALAPKGVAGHVVFTLDLPDRSVKEGNRLNNYHGFFYYLIDPNACTPKAAPEYGVTCPEPTGLAEKVPFPLNPTLLDPDTQCDATPDITITQSMTINKVELSGDPVTLQPKQTGELHITLTNDSDVAVTDLVVNSSLAGAPFAPVTIPAHSTVTLSTTFTPTMPSVNVSLPTAVSRQIGVQTGTAFVILSGVCGDDPVIVALDPNPNPVGDVSRVMRGGRAVRYFKVIDPRTGQPVNGAQVRLRIPGIIGRPVFVTKANGVLGTSRTRVSADGKKSTEEFVEGVAVSFADYVGRDWQEATVSVETINGSRPKCGDPTLFKVFVDPLDFTYQFEAGGSIQAGFDLFKASAKVDIGGSYTLRLFHRGREPKLTEPGLYRIDWERKTFVGADASLKWKGFGADNEFGTKDQPGERNFFVKSKAEGFGGSVQVTGKATQAYRYTFPGPPSTWSAQKGAAFLALLFPSVAESDAQSLVSLANLFSDNSDPDAQLYTRVMRDLIEPIVGTEDVYKPYRSARIGSLSLFGKADVTGFDGKIDLNVRKDAQTDAPQASVQGPNGTETGKKPDANSAPKAEENEAPAKKEESKPTFTAKANLNGEILLTYEQVDQLRHEVGDPKRANANAVGEKVVGMIQSLSFDGKYDWSSAYTTNFANVKAEIDKPNTSYVQEPKVVKDRAKEGLDWLAKRLTHEEGGKFDRGLVFRLYSRIDPNAAMPVWTPWRLEITFRGPKGFGYLDGQPQAAEGLQYSLTFAVEGEAKVNRVISEIFDQVAAFRVLLAQREQERVIQAMSAFKLATEGKFLSEPEAFDGNKLYEWFMKFVRAVLIYGGRPQAALEDATPSYPEFYEEIKKGKTDDTDFKLGAWLNSKFKGVSVQPFSLDSSMTYKIGRGRVVRGMPVVLEDYSDLDFGVAQNPKEIIQQKIDEAIPTPVKQAWDAYKKFTKKEEKGDGSGGGSVKTDSASLNTRNAADFANTDSGMVPFRVSANAGAQATPYTAQSMEAPLGKPHYGLSGIHVFETDRRTTLSLDEPATLTMSYSDSAVAGFDENLIRLFRWNGTRGDWDLIPGALDIGANTLTATVTKVGIYTLGVVMPAGKLTWKVTGVSRTTGANARTVVSIESENTVRMNDGSAAAAGTLIHTFVTNPGGGDVVTADASGLEGNQVAVDPDGKVRIQFSLPGSQSTLSIAAFSDIGTVDGFADIVIPQS